MGSLLKMAIGVVLVLVIGSYIVATPTVSSVIQAGQKGVDPMVSGANAVKHEVKNLTDEAHQEVYKRAVKNGIKKVVDTLNQLVDETRPLDKVNPKENKSDGSI